MLGKCQSRESTFKKIWCRTMVIYWSRFRIEVVLPRTVQGAWANIVGEMLLEFKESGHPTFPPTTPLYRGQLKSNGRGKLSMHFAADDFTIDTVFRIILSVNQLSVYGAVAALCEEFESHQDGSGEPEILIGQSIVLGEIKAEAPLQNEDSMNDQIS